MSDSTGLHSTTCPIITGLFPPVKLVGIAEEEGGRPLEMLGFHDSARCIYGLSNYHI